MITIILIEMDSFMVHCISISPNKLAFWERKQIKKHVDGWLKYYETDYRRHTHHCQIFTDKKNNVLITVLKRT